MADGWVIEITNPLTQGQRVRDMQWLLSGHNRWLKQTYEGEIDGFFGPKSGQAAKEMKWYLGYPEDACVPTAGSTLRSYLLPKSSEDSALLPLLYQERKRARAPLVHYPLARVGELIGYPYQGTHRRGNWESDRACDIAVPKGTDVLACFEGVIGPQFGPLQSGNPALAGLRLHLVGEKDEAYYAHLSAFKQGLGPGDHVAVGEYLGESGVANGVAHLHFALKVGWPTTFLATTSKV